MTACREWRDIHICVFEPVSWLITEFLGECMSASGSGYEHLRHMYVASSSNKGHGSLSMSFLAFMPV
jgi:hypothetical protein